MALPAIVVDLADLVLGRRCLGCGAPGPELCPACLTHLRGRLLASPRPGLHAPAFAATPYAGLAREVMLAYKQEGCRSLATPLGSLLADAIRAAMRSCGQEHCSIVPIPGHRRARRGFDALGSISREAHRNLVASGLAVTQDRLLRARAPYPALKGLGRSQRQAHVTGAFDATMSTNPASCLLLVDDVITTGATMVEAVATLERAGMHVAGVAVVAATPSLDRWARSPAPAPARRPS